MTFVTNTVSDKRYGFAAQAAFGTAVIDSAAITEVDCEPLTIDRDTKMIQIPSSVAHRTPAESSLYTHTKGAAPKLALTGPVKKLDIADFLYAHIQNVTEAGTTPYGKTFTFAATQPDFSADAGYFATWIERDPTASYSIKAVDCISSELKLSIQAGGLLMFSQNWIGRGSPAVTSNPSGTWARNDQDFFHFEDITLATINFGGGVQNVKLQALEITLTQVVEGVGHDGSGDFETFVIKERDLSFSLTINKDAQTQTAVTNVDADTSIDVRVGWGNATPGTDDGDFDIQFNGKLDKSPELSTDGLLTATLTGKILHPSSGDALQIVVADADDRAW